MEKILDKFLRYVSFDTQSSEESPSQPSTAKQLKLLSQLQGELQQMGIEASLDEYGYVMATIPANTASNAPKLGFIAHVDTSPDAPGCNIKPQIIENYDGGDVVLGDGKSLKVSEFPEMQLYRGQTLITTALYFSGKAR